MTPQEFAKRIRERFPGSYDSVDDFTLSQKIIQKYPQYRGTVSFSPPGKIESLRQSASQAQAESKKSSSPLGITKETVKETGEILGIQPTARRIAAMTAPFVEKDQELLPGVVEELVGGVTSPQESTAKEFTDIALDLPLISLGLSKTLASSLSKQMTKSGVQTVLNRPLLEIMQEFAPEQLQKVLKTDVVQKGKDVVQDVKGFASKTKEKIKEAPSAIKSKVTGVTPKTGSAKFTEDSLEIGREKITPKVEARAAEEKRMFTEGRTGEVKIRPSRREELVGDSIRPLVVDGRIKADNLPFENIKEIDLEVNRINQGVRGMLLDFKAKAGPFNENQLRKRLNDVKKDSEIIFTTDSTIERTYDALVDEFVKEVSKKDIVGLFDARQSFDKIPAVKKLLDGLKGAEGENLRRQAVLDIRRAANEYISDLLPANNPFKAELKREHYMLEAMGNLAEKSKGLTGTTNITRFLDRNPTLKMIIRQAVPFGVGATVF